VLERALRAVRGRYDDVVIDTAPYLGLLTINAIAATDYVLVPVSCEYLPILGLKLFTETLGKIRKQLGVRAEIIGYLLTMYDDSGTIPISYVEEQGTAGNAGKYSLMFSDENCAYTGGCTP